MQPTLPSSFMYCPIGHNLQLVFASYKLYIPGAQFVHPEPWILYFALGQRAHALARDDPAMLPEPSGQNSHSVWPGVKENLPELHKVQPEPPMLYSPGEQSEQLSNSELPAELPCPSGQARQTSALVCAVNVEYKPAKQSIQISSEICASSDVV